MTIPHCLQINPQSVVYWPLLLASIGLLLLATGFIWWACWWLNRAAERDFDREHYGE